jgi:hypothetical protein
LDVGRSMSSLLAAGTPALKPVRLLRELVQELH